MKTNIISLFALALLLVPAIAPHKTAETKPQSTSVASDSLIKKEEGDLRWFYYQPILINAEENYSLRVDASGNPDTSETMSPYHPNAAYYINEAQYLFSATDSTDETIDLLPNNRLDVIANYNSNGSATVHITAAPLLQSDTQVWTDSRTINDVDSAFVMPDNTTMIGTGLVLWRSSSTGTFSGWDGCSSLSSFASNSALSLWFAADKYVQIVTLMELETHDDGVWIFQQHTYSHVVGIYSFRTTSII